MQICCYCDNLTNIIIIILHMYIYCILYVQEVLSNFYNIILTVKKLTRKLWHTVLMSMLFPLLLPRVLLNVFAVVIIRLGVQVFIWWMVPWLLYEMGQDFSDIYLQYLIKQYSNFDIDRILYHFIYGIRPVIKLSIIQPKYKLFGWISNRISGNRLNI